jgi:hypothetical protein
MIYRATRFSRTYAEAREKFVAAAKARGCEVESHALPARGRRGETLASDVARLGARAPSAS